MILRRTLLLAGLAALAASSGCYAGYVDDYGYGYGYPSADVYIGGGYYPRSYGAYYYGHPRYYGYGYHGYRGYRGYHGAPVYGYRGHIGRPYAGGYGHHGGHHH